MTPKEIAKNFNVSSCAVLFQVKRGRVKAKKIDGHWDVDEKDYANFVVNKYKRNSDENQGKIFNPQQAAKFIGCKTSRIYFHLYTGKIKANRNGAAWQIHIDDLLEYKKTLKPETNFKIISYARQFKKSPKTGSKS